MVMLADIRAAAIGHHQGALRGAQPPSHSARPVHLIITMMKWIRTGRLSTKNSLFLGCRASPKGGVDFKV